MRLLPPSQNQKPEKNRRKRLESTNEDKKNVSSILKYFEEKTKTQNMKPVNNSTTSLMTRNLMLHNQSTESADVHATREVKSDSNFGGPFERTTPSRRRVAARTSSKKNNHETSQTDPRAQLTWEPRQAPMGTGCSTRIQGD